MASSNHVEEPMEFENQEQSDKKPEAHDKALLTLSLKWSDKYKIQKMKFDLQKTLQTWFSKHENKPDCTVLSILEDGNAVINIEPPPGVIELQKLTGETLLTKEKKISVTILCVILGTPKQFAPTADDASQNLTPSVASDNTPDATSEPPAVEEQNATVPTAGNTTKEDQMSDKNCVLSVSQFWYVNHIYKEELGRILEENEVEIRPEVIVKFEAKDESGNRNEALAKFTDLVQMCVGNWSGSVYPLNHTDPDRLSKALRFIMNKDNKLLASMSSNEMTVCGPLHNHHDLDLVLNAKQKSNAALEEAEEPARFQNFNDELCLKMAVKDNLSEAGLAIDENHWKNLNSSDKFQKIKIKFNVDFKESTISEGKVNVKATYNRPGGNPAMECHAVRALLRLYQKFMTSPMHLPPPYGASWLSGSEEASSGAGMNRHSTQNSKESAEGGATGDSKDDQCCICMSAFNNKQQLRCKHEFCGECLQSAVQHNGPICPICKDVFGEIKGDQPDGTMSYSRHPLPLPGWPNCGHIQITYCIPNGKQMENHPKPGQYYAGTTRMAYLPDNKEGNEVLRLLRKAFDQRLIFTVGASRTTGAENAVTWNDIHHKTSMTGGPSNYGYPDDKYLSRVKEELKAKGIE